MDKSIPVEFHKSNIEKSNRCIDLAEKTKQWIIEKQISVTTNKFIEASKIVDEDGKGISQATIFRNKRVHEIFSSICTNSTPRKKNRKRVFISKSKRSCDSDLRTKYKNYSKLEILKLFENQKEENRVLNNKNIQLLSELNLLKSQNNNQLILLTKLIEKSN